MGEVALLVFQFAFRLIGCRPWVGGNGWESHMSYSFAGHPSRSGYKDRSIWITPHATGLSIVIWRIWWPLRSNSSPSSSQPEGPIHSGGWYQEDEDHLGLSGVFLSHVSCKCCMFLCFHSAMVGAMDYVWFAFGLHVICLHVAYTLRRGDSRIIILSEGDWTNMHGTLSSASKEYEREKTARRCRYNICLRTFLHRYM